MDEDKTLTQAPTTNGLQPTKVSPYDLLMRQSRKLGELATRTYDITKEFLKQDVSNLHPDQLLFAKRIPLKSTSKGNETKTHPKNRSDTPETSTASRTGEGIREESERDAHTLDPGDGLRKIIRKSHQLLASAQTVILPMNLFPDSVTIDRTKVTVTKRTFFWTSSVISIRIEDVLNVGCSTGPIFGSLIISSRVMNSTDHYEIDYFWRKDAIYLKQIIQGYVIAQHNQIDTSHLNRRDLIRTLLELGNDSDY